MSTCAAAPYRWMWSWAAFRNSSDATNAINASRCPFFAFAFATAPHKHANMDTKTPQSSRSVQNRDKSLAFHYAGTRDK